MDKQTVRSILEPLFADEGWTLTDEQAAELAAATERTTE